MTTRPIIPAVALLLCACAPTGDFGPVQSPQPLDLTLENIYGPRGRAGASEISPDGRYVAVSATGPAGAGIYLVETGSESDRGESSAAAATTSAREVESSITDGATTATAPASSPPNTGAFWVQGNSPAWFPGSNRIVFRQGGDLWMVAVGSNEPVQLTDDDHDERAPRVSPNGRRIAFYSGRSGHQDIWMIALDGSAEPVQVTFDAFAPDDFRWSPAWAPDSRRIAYISNASDYWHDDLWVVDTETLESRQISRTLMASTEPAWSPDGTKIALLGTHKNGYWYEDLADIFVIDPATATERTVAMQIHATDWLHRMRIFWSGDGELIYFPYHERGDFDLWSVPAQGGVATRVTNMGGSLGSISASDGAQLFAFTRATPARGSDVDLIPATGGPLRRLTHFAATWNTVVEPSEISFRSFDGLYIQGFLYMPPSHVPGDRHPALVQVHGGGTNSYLHGENLFEQYLASKGYVVLAVNYRGGSGFGREFQDLGINDWANGQARDAAAAGEFLRTLDFVHGKVGIYGYSYGGITSMAAIARAPGVFDAAVPMAGIYDFGDAYNNADRLGRIFIRTGHSGSPGERPEIYAVSNTLARIANIDTPLLIMHGELDVRAPYRQFEIAVAELERHGKVFESRSYPGETHGLRPAARIDMYRRAEEFFERMLRRYLHTSGAS